MKREIIEIAKRTKEAQYQLANVSVEIINRCLKKMASMLIKNSQQILEANRKDITVAEKEHKSKAFIDRLSLTPKRIKEMANSLEEIASLRTPVNEIIKGWTRPNGLVINKVRVPIGVICIIYEARPNVTSDCVGLCMKTFNGLILRGGGSSFNSNITIINILKRALKEENLPEDTFNYIPFKEREAINVLLKYCKEYIDLVIPRGGEGLIKIVEKTSRIPVIKHYKGICHIYVDKEAEIQMALDIILNAKVQRPGVCNAVETLLIHQDIANQILPLIKKKLEKYNVEIRGCPLTKKIIPQIKSATLKDWKTEYLDLVISIKIVSGVEEAIEHINKYGSKHSDSIITNNYLTAKKFMERVDSACVYHNASTRFTDGYQFGLGAEMGISTDKLHARGPMGLEELTTYKYLIYGTGQIRS